MMIESDIGNVFLADKRNSQYAKSVFKFGGIHKQGCRDLKALVIIVWLFEKDTRPSTKHLRIMKDFNSQIKWDIFPG